MSDKGIRETPVKPMPREEPLSPRYREILLLNKDNANNPADFHCTFCLETLAGPVCAECINVFWTGLNKVQAKLDDLERRCLERRIKQ